MKKRGKNCLALLLACILTIASVPQTVPIQADEAADTMKISRYDITTLSAGNGNCRIQIDGKEVSSAAPGQRVTIIPEPADTYEPDTVTVTKKNDDSTQITVTDNGFIMPDYPVMVYVTFRKPSCHITLPSGIGYTAASQQSSTAEYGSSYSFTITLDEDHEASEDFSVTSNGNILTPSGTNGTAYTYTFYYITENQTIKVTGVRKKEMAGTKDEAPPEITITLNGTPAGKIENGKTYYGDPVFTVRDDTLETVVVDGKTTKVTDRTYTLTIPADNGLHTILATDRAGNQISYRFYVKEIWLRDGISISGRYSLKPDNSYKLCTGRWKVKGDNTLYEGDRTVYVAEGSDLDFQKQ